jgi:hypothetical protein
MDHIIRAFFAVFRSRVKKIGYYLQKLQPVPGYYWGGDHSMTENNISCNELVTLDMLTPLPVIRGLNRLCGAKQIIFSCSLRDWNFTGNPMRLPL